MLSVTFWLAGTGVNAGALEAAFFLWGTLAASAPPTSALLTATAIPADRTNRWTLM